MRQGGCEEGPAPEGVLPQAEEGERGEEGDHRGGKEAGAYAWWMLKENKTYEELSPWKVH